MNLTSHRLFAFRFNQNTRLFFWLILQKIIKKWRKCRLIVKLQGLLIKKAVCHVFCQFIGSFWRKWWSVKISGFVLRASSTAGCSVLMIVCLSYSLNCLISFDLSLLQIKSLHRIKVTIFYFLIRLTLQICFTLYCKQFIKC